MTSSTGAGVTIDNDDHCNVNVNQSGDYYSDNIWVIFNHMYDVQTGVFANQQIHCGNGLCCCPGAFGGGTTCCSGEGTDPEPFYDTSRVYVVGNIFNHIQPFLSEEDPGAPSNFGQAVNIGKNVQARVVNNTIYLCSQGLHIACTHDSGNQNDCPPYTDPDNLTRNTSVTMVNNVILDTPEDPEHPNADTHVRVCSGPPVISEFTLTNGDLNGDLGFARNLHFGTYRTFQIQSGPWSTVEQLQADELTRYGFGSYGDLAEHNPNFVNPGHLLFDLTPGGPPTGSPIFMFTGGVWDAAYDAFEAHNWGITFPAGIRHDYDGHAYGATPAIGAFGE